MVRRTLLAGFVYALAVSAFTWPLVLHLRSLLGAADPAGDPSLNLWALGWDFRTLSVHPGWLLTGRVFDANIFFPAARTLAYSDHLLLQSLALWPFYALTHDLVFCYNLLLLASLVGAALAMHVLVRTLVGTEPAAYVAGLIFGFAPYHFTHLTHIQLQALYFLPLSFLFLHRLFTAERRADPILCGLVLGLQAVSSVYYGVIGSLGIVCAGATLAILTGRGRDWGLIRRALTAAAIAVIVAMPWSIPYVRVASETGAGRNLSEAARGSAVLSSYVQAPNTNLLYGRTEWLRPSPAARLPRKDDPEQALFPGFCPLLLAMIGALAAPRGLKRTAAAYTIVAIVGLVLSLGPEGLRPLYAGLYHGLFGMAALRAAARFSVLTLFGIAVLSAMAVRALEIRHPRAYPLILTVVLAIIVLEYSNGTIAFPSAPALTSNAGRWLRDQPGSGAVICVPMGLFAGNTPCMLQSLEHGRPIVNGYSGVRPPFFEALVDAMSQLPTPRSVLALHDVGVEYVISDRPLATDASLSGVLVERVAFGDQRVYQVLWSPATETMLTGVADVRPPEPGPPPFAPGESATYRIRWTSGPLDVPAGQATIAVLPPQGSESFRFVVSASTAPWVSRFFETDAVLEATSNHQLLPLTYREAISEGTRRIVRQLAFDAARHEVRITSGGTSITLPLNTDARDPISALFYIRTLPIGGASHFALPLSDNGRRLRLDVTVDPVETILLDGHAWSAWKIEPQLSDRIERHDSLVISAWVSADARHIPLVMEVSAGFGSARVELVSYRDH